MTTKTEAPARRTAWRVQALADDWGLNVKAIYALIASGELRSVKAGRHHLIPDSEVQRYLAGDATDAA